MSAIDAVQIPSSNCIEGAMSSRPEYLPHPTDTPASTTRQLSVFNKKKVMLSDDLGLGSRLRKIIEDLIEVGGGTVTTTILKADIYVCHYRQGKDYVIASRTGKDVGNLSWLYYIIIHDEWTSPFRRLLHYPIPRNGIPGFQGFRISLSNYGGEARIYLENLVVAAGGEYTKNMKQDNTHLITARKSSEKCEAAAEWNINMINHLWIEESYAKCEVQSLANPRYTHFPPRTNLGEVIGQTQFDPAVLEKLYFPEDPEDSGPEYKRHVRSAMQAKDQNTAVAGKLKTDAVATNTTPTTRNKSKPTPSRVIPHAITPSNRRLIGQGKENETPSSTGSRGAKDRALSKLQDMAPDMALYEKEKKRAGGGVWGGKRAADRIDRETPRKRSSSPSEDESDITDEGSRGVKRPKTGFPPIRMRLLITGYKRWLGSFEREEAERVCIWNFVHWKWS
jgi:twin BRCT domain